MSNFITYRMGLITGLGLLFLSLHCHGDTIESMSYLDRGKTQLRFNEKPERLSYPSNKDKRSPKWLVLGGQQVVPGSIYRVTFESLQKDCQGDSISLTFRASLIHNGRQITSGKVSCTKGELSSIPLQVPFSSVDGKWELLLEGKESDTELSIFKNSTLLKYTPNFLTILIQTSRPVYNAGQTVRFRVVLLNRELKPYDEPVYIFVRDPSNHIMRRWPSRLSGDGVINLSFELPSYPLIGNWTIQVKAKQQIQNQTILVEHYFRPRFEVFVRLQQAFKITDEFISGVIVANMTNWRSVHGNCSVKLQMASNHDFPIPTKYETISEQFFYNFTGVQPFSLPLQPNGTLGYISEHPDEVVLRVFASVGDNFGWRIQNGWALTRILQDKIKLDFIEGRPLFFRPGMPMTISVFVSYADGHPIDEEELKNASLKITFKSVKGVSSVLINGSSLIEKEGIAKASFTPSENDDHLEISARIESSRGMVSEASMVAMKHHSPRNRHLQIQTSTIDAIPAENIVLHVRNDFYTMYFNFIVVSNGLILHSDREKVNDPSVPTITTFLIPASVEMAPVANILVWVTDTNEEIISDSISVSVNPLTRHEVNVEWNEHKDHTGGSAEVQMMGEKGSFFAASAVWEETFMMDAGHNLDEARVIHQMLGFYDNFVMEEVAAPNVGRVTTRSRFGEGANVKLFSISNTGPDVPTTFRLSGLVMLTDALFYYHPSSGSDSVSCEASQLQCLTGGCYDVDQRCDGVYNCPDSSDESRCPHNIDPQRHFRLHRISRMHRFYDPDDGDWGWKDIRREGREIRVFTFPKRPQNWVFSVFAVGKQKGLGVMKKNIQFDSAGPFMLTVEGPPVARMWEQVGLTVGVFNFHKSVVAVFVTLPHSPDYQSFFVEKNGIVDSYNPRKVHGNHQHVVWILPSTSMDVHIPIVFTRMGKIEVTVRGSTQMQKDSHTIIIDVIPEGATIGKHTSILFDLKSRAVAYEFLDIHLNESPLIPYSLERGYIYGTPQGHISVTGDVVGPAFPEIPVGADSLLGSPVMGAETSAYDFAANIWTLHYLRLSNQLTETITYKVLKAVNVPYASLSRYQSKDGSFSNWIGSEPSVWLTAHAIRSLWVAAFPDWENILYIDPIIIQKGVNWILNFQTEHGSFTETPHYLDPLNSKLDPRSRHSWMPKYQNISLTAYVVISLSKVMTALTGPLHTEATFRKEKAVKYLEQNLKTVDDPYDLALVTWALITANSEEKGLAFSKFDAIKRTSGSRIYWSREPIAFNNLVFEDNQRPFLQPKDDQKWDAHAVETTAYALLIYLKRGGIGIIQENIVRFLASMRELDGGLISTVDSLVAMEALVEYADKARLRDVTEMSVFIEHSATPNHKIEVHLNNSDDLSQIRSFDLNHLYGHLSIVGHGSGQALVQLDYIFGVDTTPGLDVPPVPSFDFELHAKFTGRNNSYVAVTSCQKWINTNETETSGLTVVTIHLPSGYYIMQDELIEMVHSRKVRNLRWALRTDTQVHFFFNKLDSDPVCFTYQLERWFPVSNHSRHNLAVIYELYQPDTYSYYQSWNMVLQEQDAPLVCVPSLRQHKFTRINHSHTRTTSGLLYTNWTKSHTYQPSQTCPYCPFYGGSQTAELFKYILVICFLGIIFAWKSLENDLFS